MSRDRCTLPYRNNPSPADPRHSSSCRKADDNDGLFLVARFGDARGAFADCRLPDCRFPAAAPDQPLKTFSTAALLSAGVFTSP